MVHVGFGVDLEGHLWLAGCLPCVDGRGIALGGSLVGSQGGVARLSCCLSLRLEQIGAAKRKAYHGKVASQQYHLKAQDRRAYHLVFTRVTIAKPDTAVLAEAVSNGQSRRRSLGATC